MTSAAAPAKRTWLPAALGNPLLFGLILLVAGAALLAIPTDYRFFVVLALLLIYIVMTVVALIMEPHWWVRALVALLMGPIVMFGLIFISEAYEEKSIGEASLAFLGPMMLHWIIVPITGLIKLGMRARPDPAAGNREPGAGNRESTTPL